jgi:hypothetical protein
MVSIMIPRIRLDTSPFTHEKAFGKKIATMAVNITYSDEWEARKELARKIMLVIICIRNSCVRI